MAIKSADGNPAEARVGRSILGSSYVRIAALLALLTTAAIYESFHLAALTNADIWWHLRTGLWILQNHTFPHTGLFSQYPDRSWIATDWGYDILIGAAYKLLGLRAIPALLMSFKVALAFVCFLLARGLRGNFWSAVVLSALAQFVIVDLPPLPMLVSILFFGVELMLLLRSRQQGELRPLYWLPLLFFVWANLHTQFVNGLFLLGVYLLAEVAERLMHRRGIDSFPAARSSLVKTFAVAGLSVAATLLTPYPFELIRNIFKTAYSGVLFEYLPEMYAMAFRRPQHFALLLLVMAAFLTLGRQRSRDLFKFGVMGVFVMLAFRIQRDVWCVALPSIAILADGLADCHHATESPSGPVWKWEGPAAAMLVLLVLGVAILRLPGRAALMQRVSQDFPAKACDFIRDNHLPAPLYNHLEWGGFLIWYLPEYPVAMDGRLNLYGDELTTIYHKVTSGTQRLETDPSFSRAQTLLLERKAGMTKALTTLPALSEQFHVAYQDDLATVLVRR
jgi:hypothetical protein